MIWLTATDLSQWADTRRAQEILPLLVRRLILASASEIGGISMPAGDSIFRPGWDGLLFANIVKWPVPEGASVWEFGASNDIRGKATEDFKKRTEDPLGSCPQAPRSSSVTPRRWQEKVEGPPSEAQPGRGAAFSFSMLSPSS